MTREASHLAIAPSGDPSAFASTSDDPRPTWARLAAGAGVVFWSTDSELRVTAADGASDVGGRLLGALGLGERGGSEPAERALAAHRRALRGERVALHVEQDGSSWEVRLEPLRGPDGELRGVAGMATNVTERESLETRLRQRERELASIFLHSPDTITRYDRAHRVCFMSAAVERETGIPASAFIGRTMTEMEMPADLVARWDAGIDRVFTTGAAEEEEFAFTGPDGVEHVYHTHVVPEPDERGAVLHVLTMTRDITARVYAERAARASDAALRSLVAQSLTGIYIIQDDRFVFVNPRLAEIFGYDAPEAVVGLPVERLVDPADRERVVENVRRRLAGERAMLQYEFRGRRADGALVEVEVYGSRSEHEGRPAIVGTLLDVTERTRARAALEASEERFRALVERSTDLIAILDVEGRFRYASPSHQRVLGVSPESLEGRFVLDPHFERHVHPDDLAAGREALEEALRIGTAKTARPIRFRHADGTWRALSIVFADLRDNPSVRGIVANSRDVTEQHALEAQLREVQKLEAIGRLAGGVAHDFNNILAAISGYAQLLRESLSANDPRRADVEEIITASNRGAGVTRQLLAFSRRQALQTEVLDLAAVVRELGRMLRSLLPASIALDLPSPRRSVHVRAVRAQLEQIVMNLAVNARDAMPSGGRLALDVQAREEASGAVRALLIVRDTGVGMSPEVRARIFEPFFTTKAQGQGTGLGLATVFGLVRQFGGGIEVSSEEGLGTTFEVTFPAVDAPLTVDAGAATVVPEPDGARARRVLLVEDEFQVREVARRLLQRAGYHVVDVANGAEALVRAERGEGFDIVLTDAAMPGMSGWELATRLTALRPDLPVVLMSGYAELCGSTEQTAGRIRAFLEKPFSARRLLESVADALQG